MKKSDAVVLITGGSAGIGRACAALLADMGCHVYEVSRSGKDANGIHHMDGDVRNEMDVCAAIEQVIALEGRIDVLINNAGYGISGAVEFTETNAAQDLFDVNYFGSVRAVRAAASHMRKQRSGRIVNISSVAARIPIPFQTHYSAAKAALDAYTLALDSELRPYGVRAISVLPGDIRTSFTESRQKQHIGDDLYSGRISRSVAGMEKDEQNGMSPERAARTIIRAALAKRPPRACVVGGKYRIFLFLQKILPAALVRRIVEHLYG